MATTLINLLYIHTKNGEELTVHIVLRLNKIEKKIQQINKLLLK